MASSQNSAPSPSSGQGRGSIYLQERLAESRGSRAVSTGWTSTPRGGRDDYIFDNDEEPIQRPFGNSPSRTHARKPSDHGSVGARGAMGVREMERQTDKLSKENFSLKLEIHHRDEALAKLREEKHEMNGRLKKVTKLEAENKELMEINEQTVKELEIRDEAVKEAIDRINTLEDEIAFLRQTTLSRPATSQADTGYNSAASIPSDSRSRASSIDIKPTVNESLPEMPTTRSPPKLKIPRGEPADLAAKRMSRMPSSLSEQKAPSSALRQLFLTGDSTLRSIRSRNSMFSIMSSRIEDNDAIPPSPPSPALSDVSELGSEFFGRRGEGAPVNGRYEDPGSSLFDSPRASTKTSTPIAPVATTGTLTTPSHESALHGPQSEVPTSGKDRPWHHRQTSSARPSDKNGSNPTLQPSPSRSPRLAPENGRHQRTPSKSVSPRSSSDMQSTVDAPLDLSTMPYGGFPTGKSIVHGTPSRFAHPMPAANNLLFDGDGIEYFKPSSSLHHSATTNTPSSHRRRSRSSDPPVSTMPPLYRNHTMGSMPPASHSSAHTPHSQTSQHLDQYSHHHGHAHPPHHTHRRPGTPQLETSYRPYRPPTRDSDYRPVTSSSVATSSRTPSMNFAPQSPATAVSNDSPLAARSTATTSTNLNPGLVPGSSPTTHHQRPSPARRNSLSFTQGFRSMTSTHPSASGDSELPSSDRGLRKTGRSWEESGTAAAAEGAMMQTGGQLGVSQLDAEREAAEEVLREGGRGMSRLGGGGKKGRSPSVDPVGGKKRWPWRLGGGKRGDVKGDVSGAED
ncbi:MAG: hypothetical protein M1820_006455 [Bogoriella megaspora]|nr:MAG: hypothetical protein M1820_006455 [Bogoriella megaspora]